MTIYLPSGLCYNDDTIYFYSVQGIGAIKIHHSIILETVLVKIIKTHKYADIMLILAES